MSWIYQVTDMIEYVYADLHLANLNTAHKRKGRSRLYQIVENDFATTVKLNENMALILASI